MQFSSVYNLLALTVSNKNTLNVKLKYSYFPAYRSEKKMAPTPLFSILSHYSSYFMVDAGASTIWIQISIVLSPIVGIGVGFYSYIACFEFTEWKIFL